jgi:addiction module HigA family antidote
MEMFNPPHPGEIVREDCLIPAGLSVTAGAKHLSLSRQSLSKLINGRNGISADMALRLEKAGWSTAEAWLRNQASYDLWQARKRDEVREEEKRKASLKKAAKKASATKRRRAKRLAAADAVVKRRA